MPSRPTEESAIVPSRRTVITSAGAVGAVAVVGAVSACGSGESGAPEQAPVEATVATAEVPIGSGVVVDETYVVTQPQAGEFHAFSSVCTHQGCQVRTVTEAEIVCPCHSSRFSTTTGEVVEGPATEPLPAFDVSVSDGAVTISGQ